MLIDQLLNDCITQNKQYYLNNIDKEPQKTPLASSLDLTKKNEIKNKLKNNILAKNQMRHMPSKKKINEQTDEIKQMFSHPKMNQNILELYANAIAYNPKQSLAKPTDIFNNTEHYKAEYYQYILGLIKTMKEQNININQLDNILNNPYGLYMSNCIGCDINPFTPAKGGGKKPSNILDIDNNNNKITNEEIPPRC